MRYVAVVLYFRLGARVYDTLDALVAQSKPPDKIVIVDNASQDRVLDGAESRYDNCVLLRLPSNEGYAVGMNAGAAAVGDDPFDAILFLTHEVILTPECVERLTSVLQTSPAIGMVGPALRLGGNGALWSLGGTITRWGNVRHRTTAAPKQTVEWLDGACLLVRRESLRTCGAFDEDYFLYWEDVDLSFRISKLYEVRCVADATAYQTTGSAPIYFRIRNQILFWRKHSSRRAVAAAICAAVAKAVLVDLRARNTDYLRARLLGIKHGFTGRLAPEPLRMTRA